MTEERTTSVPIKQAKKIVGIIISALFFLYLFFFFNCDGFALDPSLSEMTVKSLKTIEKLHYIGTW